MECTKSNSCKNFNKNCKDCIETYEENMEDFFEPIFVKLSVEPASVDLVMSKERETELEQKLKEYKKGMQNRK